MSIQHSHAHPEHKILIKQGKMWTSVCSCGSHLLHQTHIRETAHLVSLNGRA